MFVNKIRILNYRGWLENQFSFSESKIAQILRTGVV